MGWNGRGEFEVITNATYTSDTAQSPHLMLWASLHPFEDLGHDRVDGGGVVDQRQVVHGLVVVEARRFD